VLIEQFFRRLKQFHTLHVFLLEIIAVFIGITASLVIDDWRENQQDQKILDHLLQATHYNALQDRAVLQQSIAGNSEALRSALLLAYGDTDAISDEELIRHFDLVGWAFNDLELQPGYQRLVNTSLSIPFDHTMAELDRGFSLFGEYAKLINNLNAATVAQRRKLRAAAGLPVDPRRWSSDLADEEARMYDELTALLFSNDAYVANIDDAGAIRETLRSETGRAILRDLVGLRYQFGAYFIQLSGWNEQVIRSIRNTNTDITLPISFMELSGGATPVDWSGGMRMQQDADDPNVWRLRVRLTEGQLKFRADGNFASNWGAPAHPENRAAPVGFEFGGDVSTVFPRGVGAFNGLNIPVRAGTYDVTFNSQSFEYSFERVDSGGETDD